MCWHFDHSKGRNVKGINVLTLLYAARVGPAEEDLLSVPLSFELIEKTEWESWTDSQGHEQHRRVSTKSKNERFREMLLQARANQVRYLFGVADSWFTSKENMTLINWGYVRLSVVLGLLFSVLSSSVPGMKLKDLAWEVGKSTWWKAPTFEEIAEILYGLLYHMNVFISNTLNAAFGDLIGGMLSLIISVNVVYGFIVVLYSLLLLRFVSQFSSPAVPRP